VNCYRIRCVALLFLLLGGERPVLVAQSDTTVLTPFVVQGRLPIDMVDAHREVLDSLQLAITKGGSLADLLSQVSPVTLRYYGPGQLASAGFRGASASQTVLVWNGIRINNPMLMQTDLSSIPLGLIDEGRISFGSGTLGHASGAFGGVIALNNNLTGIPLGQAILIDQSIGSFGSDHYQAQMRWNRRGFSGKTLYYRESTENNYPYIDNFSTSDWQTKTRRNASFHQQGMMHQMGFASGANLKGKLMIWGQQKTNHIPYPIHQPQDAYQQYQTEDFIKVLLGAEAMFGGVHTEFFSGFQAGIMTYYDERSRTDARHFTRNIQQGVKLHGGGHLWQWRLHADDEFQQVVTSAYDQVRERRIHALYGALMYTPTVDWYAGAATRAELVKGQGLDAMPSLMAGRKFGKLRQHSVKGMMMFNRQLPGFNDLYWVPGGNPDLLPERGVGGEICYEKSPDTIGSIVIQPQFTTFFQRIDQKISWLPDSGAMWSAFNIGLVQLYGLDALISARYKHHLHILIRGQYTAAQKIGEDGGRELQQLVYQPHLSGSGLLRFQSKHGILSWETTFTGKRFTNAANTNYLPPYTLSNLRLLSSSFKFGFVDLQASFSVVNLFNVSYQGIAWFPMPGRTFRVGLSMKMTGN
jgi:vitamin B12 transporter